MAYPAPVVYDGDMANYRLEAGMEIDFITGKEMGDLLSPTQKLLKSVRDLLAADNEREVMTQAQDFPIVITAGIGKFAAPVFRPPNGYSASLVDANIWTPTTQLAYQGTPTEKIGPLYLAKGSQSGNIIAAFNVTPTGLSINLTWGKAQAPFIRDGEYVWLVGQTKTAVSTEGLVHFQYVLSPMTDAVDRSEFSDDEPEYAPDVLGTAIDDRTVAGG